MTDFSSLYQPILDAHREVDAAVQAGGRRLGCCVTERRETPGGQASIDPCGVDESEPAKQCRQHNFSRSTSHRVAGRVLGKLRSIDQR